MSITSLLDISRRALFTQTQAIRTIGDNIANVNTPGYSRRRADIVTTTTTGAQAARVGTGVEVDKIVRLVDRYINSELVSRQSDRAMAEIRNEYLERAETPFALDNSPGKIGYQMTEFYSSLEDLRTNPSSIPLRIQVIEKGEELVQSVRNAYDQLAQLQREADNRIGVNLEDVNRISGEIAAVNSQILNAEPGGEQEALTLRDQRDQLVRDLGEYMSFNIVENSDGQYLVYLSNGFALVNGSTSRNLEYVAQPDPAVTYPVGLDGAPLGHIVYDYSSTPPPSYGDLTNIIRSGTGEMAGLLSLRGVQSATDTEAFDAQGDLVDFAARVEYIARDLLTRFNLEYLGPDEDAALGHQPSSTDLDGNPPTDVFALFAFEGIAGATGNGDVDGLGTPDLTDLTALVAGGEVANFASILTFHVDDERTLAAGRDLDPAGGSIVAASGDDANLQALLAQRDQTQNYDYLGAATVTTNTLEGLYNLTVSNAGAVSARARDDFRILTERESQLEELQSSVSGVSLDEEFAKLINFQRAFEGAARMIRVGDELLDQIMTMTR